MGARGAGRSAEGPDGSRGGGMRARNFFARPGTANDRARRGSLRPPGDRQKRVCPPPPLPHFRLPPLPRSRLPGPVRPGGDPEAQPHPGRRCPVPRPHRRRAAADSLSQRGLWARQVGAPLGGRRCSGRPGGPERERNGRGTPPPSPPSPAVAACPLLGNSFALADSSAGGAGRRGSAPFHWPGPWPPPATQISTALSTPLPCTFSYVNTPLPLPSA